MLTGYALEGSATSSSITRDGRLFTTIGVDGVTQRRSLAASQRLHALAVWQFGSSGRLD